MNVQRVAKEWKSITKGSVLHGDMMHEKAFVVSLINIFVSLLLLLSWTGSVQAQWQPIPGIPEPPFGVSESHTMYEGKTYDYGSGPEPYRIGPNGPYTHFVDPRHAAATNTDNLYGTHTKPRESYPNMRNLPAGSVVELHGEGFGAESFNGSGTASAPIFIRGVLGDEPKVKPPYGIYGDYYIIENIDFDFDGINRPAFHFGDTSRSHIAIRNNEFHNLQEIPLHGRAVISMSHREGSAKIRNILISSNHFHHMGHGRTGGKYDVTAVFPGPNSEYIWIVDNHFHHIGGDGVQLNMDGAAPEASPPNHIYIGRNTFHDNFENAVDLKMCQDVIISMNKAYHFGEHSALGSGASAAFRYGGADATPAGLARNNIWTIFNEVHDSANPDGAFLSYNTESEAFADEIYYIGNIVYDCHDNSDGNATAFGWWNQKRVYAVNNTIHNVDRAFSIAGERPVAPAPGERISIVNNIIGVPHPDSQKPSHLSIYGTSASLDRSVIRNNLFYDSSGEVKIRWGVYLDGRLRWGEYRFGEFGALRPDKVLGSLSASPKHKDASQGDFRLQSDSPAIGAGFEHSYYQTFYQRYGIRIDVDFAAQRVPDEKPDIGAHEYIRRPAKPENLRIVESGN